MSTVTPEAPRKHRPYVPETMEMKEFTFRAVLIGLVMTGILGSANAYLGLRAGMTIAATYPAAVIGMALLRLMKGSLLEENIARTVGSIGESVAAGAIFTIPAFVMADLWPATPTAHAGILELSRADDDRRHAGYSLRHPAAPRHGRGPRSSLPRVRRRFGNPQSRPARLDRRQDSLRQHGLRRLHVPAGRHQRLQSAATSSPSRSARSGRSLLLRTSTNPNVATTMTGGATIFTAPDVSPAYLGVGYIIGPRLASLNFAGGVLAWGLLVPLLTFVLGPYIQAAQRAGSTALVEPAGPGHLFLHRTPHCGGGMLVGACYTLFKMRKQLGARHGPRRLRLEEVRRRARCHQSHRPRSEFQGRFRRRRRRVPGDVRAVLLLYRRRGNLVYIASALRCAGGGGGHD